MQETVYCERANGKQEFWTYSDGQRVYINRTFAMKMVGQGAKFVKVS